MERIHKHGVLIGLKAETLDEVISLNAYLASSEGGKMHVDTRVSRTRKGHKGRGNRWAGKVKVQCPYCNKSYKNISIHIRRHHPNEPVIHNNNKGNTPEPETSSVVSTY